MNIIRFPIHVILNLYVTFWLVEKLMMLVMGLVYISMLIILQCNIFLRQDLNMVFHSVQSFLKYWLLVVL